MFLLGCLFMMLDFELLEFGAIFKGGVIILDTSYIFAPFPIPYGTGFAFMFMFMLEFMIMFVLGFVFMLEAVLLLLPLGSCIEIDIAFPN